jgi:hypothetical protein
MNILKLALSAIVLSMAFPLPVQASCTLDLGEWQGAFKTRHFSGGVSYVTVFDTANNRHVQKAFHKCRRPNSSERSCGYRGWMCTDEVQTSHEASYSDEDSTLEEEESWEGPFDEGGRVNPIKGDDGRIARWYATRDGQTIFFGECQPHGDPDEGLAECRNEVTGLELQD